jgi:hypothetical protein
MKFGLCLAELEAHILKLGNEVLSLNIHLVNDLEGFNVA